MTPHNLDTTLAALADPTRRSIIELLQHSPLCPSEVADTLRVSRPAMSRHLRILRGAGLIEQESPETDARVRVIHLRRAPFTELRTWVEEVEAFWQDQLESFKAHAESKLRSDPSPKSSAQVPAEPSADPRSRRSNLEPRASKATSKAPALPRSARRGPR